MLIKRSVVYKYTFVKLRSRERAYLVLQFNRNDGNMCFETASVNSLTHIHTCTNTYKIYIS